MSDEPDDGGLPELPYAGTSGWSGSDTSRERVEREDSDGTTRRRQEQMLDAITDAAAAGMTAYELCRHYNLPTNSVAPSLTNLHSTGHITRLKQRRGRHEVYVLPEHVNGREESPKRTRKAADEEAAYQRGYDDGYRDGTDGMLPG